MDVQLQTEELFPLWCWIDDLEQAGRISGIDATEAKVLIYLVMQERGVEPDDVIPGHSLADNVVLHF